MKIAKKKHSEFVTKRGNKTRVKGLWNYSDKHNLAHKAFSMTTKTRSIRQDNK